GINNLSNSIGCCSNDNSSHFTGTDHQLWGNVYSSPGYKDIHLFFLAPAGTYNLTYNYGTQTAPSAGYNVNFVSQGVALASNIDPSASVGQYGNYTRTDSITVSCNNQLNYDIQVHSDNGEWISSYSIVPISTSSAPCSSQRPAPPTGL